MSALTAQFYTQVLPRFFRLVAPPSANWEVRYVACNTDETERYVYFIEALSKPIAWIEACVEHMSFAFRIKRTSEPAWHLDSRLHAIVDGLKRWNITLDDHLTIQLKVQQPPPLLNPQQRVYIAQDVSMLTQALVASDLLEAAPPVT